MQKIKMRAWYSFFTLALFFFCSANLFAQQKTVTGTVSESNGEPIIGASVVIKGKASTGTVTDIDGNFSFSVPADTKTLTVSYVGMKPKDVAITAGAMNIVLESAMTDLDEVVVIGYGTAKRKDLTGSVASVGEKTLKDIPVATAAEAITGKLPGVQVTTTEGSPDADIKIRVRGGGSITQGNAPLYIVDGFPMNSISDISPSEIQSIDVLKDASSTAIYGSRGANGVILVTTKSAKEGKFTVNYSAYIGYKKIIKTLDVLSPYQFAQKQYERALLGDKVSSEYENYFGSYNDINLYNDMVGNDWQGYVFGRTGTTDNQSVTITGGTKVASYNLNYNRISDKAIMQGSDYVRNNFSMKLNSEPLNWLKLNMNVRYSDTDVRGGGANDVSGSEKSTSDSRLKNAVIYTPIPLKNLTIDDDDAEAASSLYPPTRTIPDNDREQITQLFTINGGLSITPIKDLVLRTEIGVDYNNKEDNRFYGLTNYYVTGNGNAKVKNHPAIDMTNSKSYNFRNTNTITYSKSNWFAKKDDFSVMLGEELITNKSKYLFTEVNGLPVTFTAKDAWQLSTQGTLPVTIDNHYNTPINLLSFFGRLNYTFADRYLFSGTFRADGSSKFGPNHHWGYFPSAALGWRLSEESFMESTRDWLSNLKVRFSYGTAGNNNIPSDLWKQIYESKSSGVYIPSSLGTSYWTTGTDLSNPDLKWETTITRNMGLDYGFLNNRISGSIELYKNSTKDLLIKYPTSGTGYASQYRNMGETSNKGVEFSVNALLVDKKDFTLNFAFNISVNKNRVESLGDLTQLPPGNEAWTSMTEASNSYPIYVGQPVGIMSGYVTDGMYSASDFKWNGSKWVMNDGIYKPETYEVNGNTVTRYVDSNGNVFVDNSSIDGLTWGPGGLKLKDLDGDGKITDADRTTIGNANPKNFGAFAINATYKGFDLSANFNWVYGNDIYNANKIEFTSSYYKYRNQIDIGQTYTQVNFADGTRVTDIDQLAALNQNATIWASPSGRYVFHSWAVEDGSFLRLNNLTIGYTLPRSLIKKIYLQQLRFYVSGYNLYTWTNYSGFDPEVDTRRNSKGIPTPGVDYSAYPKSRSVNFGVNVTF